MEAAATKGSNGTTALATQAAAATVEIAPRSGEIVRVGFDTVQGFEALQRIGKAFCASSLVPPQYQGPGNLANAVIAVEMAMRMRASPLMVMQNLYIVHNRPAWSSQFLISAFNSCGRFAAVRYRFTGEKNADTWGCVAYTRETASGDLIEGPEVTIAMAKAEGWWSKKSKDGRETSKWQTLPQLMMTYRAATFLIRTTAPELTMGLRTADEAEDIGADAAEVFSAPPAVAALPETAAAPPSDAVAEARRKIAEAAGILSTPTPTPEPSHDPA